MRWLVTLLSQQRMKFANFMELDMKRGVKPFQPIRRQDTKIGGCHIAFPHYFCTGAKAQLGVQQKIWPSSEFSPCRKLPPITWVNQPIGTPLFSPALWLIYCLSFKFLASLVNALDCINRQVLAFKSTQRVMRIFIHCNAATTVVSDILCCNWNSRC